MEFDFLLFFPFLPFFFFSSFSFRLPSHLVLDSYPFSGTAYAWAIRSSYHMVVLGTREFCLFRLIGLVWDLFVCRGWIICMWDSYLGTMLV